jgi:arginyl-tRNA synthetase
MSKRAGTFTTVGDVNKEVGKDIIRFMMLTRKNDISLDFDLVKVKELSKDNPIFYVQYAYVRTKSILHNAKNSSPEAYNKFISNDIDFSLLNSEEEINLIKQLACWPKIIEAASLYFEPHRIAFYMQSLAATFHSLWNLGNENKDLRFVIETDPTLTAARLALARSVTNIISSGLDIENALAEDRRQIAKLIIWQFFNECLCGQRSFREIPAVNPYLAVLLAHLAEWEDRNL